MSKRSTRTTPEVVSLPEAARRCGVAAATFRRWVREGRVKAMRSGPRLLMIEVSEIDKLLHPID